MKAPLGLLYFSRWASHEKAAVFGAIYAQSLAKRYKHVHEVAAEKTDPSGTPQKLESLTGTHTWMTEEGPVVIDVERDSVVITESLDQSTTEQLEQDLFGTFVATGR
jgi:hypothetical protein